MKINPFHKLEKAEPFTKSERAQYPLQKQHFIRGIQLRDKCNKEEAIKSSDRYFMLPNKERKEFSSSVQDAIKKEYPARGKKRHPKTGEMKPVKIEQRELPLREEKERKFSIKYTRSEVVERVKNNEYSPEMNKRMERAMINHPNDTNYQWQHGHNAGMR